MVIYLYEPQSVVSIAMEVALGEKIEETRQMEESLRAGFEALAVKVKELSMLETKNQDMLAEEAPKAKFADDFMAFLDAIQNEDLETIKSFDEKAMMDTISTMLNNNGDGDYLNVIGIILEEGVSKDTIVAAVKTDGSGGGDDNGGFSGGYGDDVPKIKLSLEEKATMVKTDGNCGGVKDLEGAMVVATEEPKSVGNGA